MDDVVKVRRSFLNRMRGFCNIFASMCSECFRYPCECAMKEDIYTAKAIIKEIDNLRDAEEERFYIENPAEEFFARIITAIRQAEKPIKSNEIVIPGECRQRKAYALKSLVKHHRIVKTVVNGTPFYSLPVTDANNTNTKNKGERHGV